MCTGAEIALVGAAIGAGGHVAGKAIEKTPKPEQHPIPEAENPFGDMGPSPVELMLQSEGDGGGMGFLPGETAGMPNAQARKMNPYAAPNWQQLLYGGF
jgi:hypothetical protein